MVAFLAQITKKKSRKAPGNSNNLLQEALKTEEIQEVGGLYCSSKCLPGLPRMTAAYSPREPNRIKKQSGDSETKQKDTEPVAALLGVHSSGSPLPSSPQVHAAAWLARPRGLSVAGPSTPKMSKARIGIRVVFWSRGLGESEARRLFFSPSSLFVLCWAGP